MSRHYVSVQHDMRAVKLQQMSVGIFLGIDGIGDVNMTDHCLSLA